MKRVFEAQNPTLNIGGSRTRGSLKPGGWFTVSLPLGKVSGTFSSLFSRQTNIMSLAKVGTGPTLRAEIPWERKIPDKIAILECAMAHGLEVIAGTRQSVAEGEDREKEMDAVIESLSSSHGEWVKEGERAVLNVETLISQQKIEAKLAGNQVRFSSDLTRFVNWPGPSSLSALTHFFLALNARLRLARASIMQDKAAIEAVLPTRSLTPMLVDKIVGSLMVGSRLAKRECVALLDNEAAQHYCEFHLKGGENNECDESQYRGLESVSES